MPPIAKPGINHLLHPKPKGTEDRVAIRAYIPKTLDQQLETEYLKQRHRHRKVSKSGIVNAALQVYLAMSEAERRQALGQDVLDEDEDL